MPVAKECRRTVTSAQHAVERQLDPIHGSPCIHMAQNALCALGGEIGTHIGRIGVHPAHGGDGRHINSSEFPWQLRPLSRRIRRPSYPFLGDTDLLQGTPEAFGIAQLARSNRQNNHLLALCQGAPGRIENCATGPWNAVLCNVLVVGLIGPSPSLHELYACRLDDDRQSEGGERQVNNSNATTSDHAGEGLAAEG